MFLYKSNAKVHHLRLRISCRQMVGMAAVVVLLGVSQGSGAAECLAPTMPRGESTSVVNLKTKIASPYFYFRSFDYNFAILVAPSSVHSALEAGVSNGNRDAKGLLEVIAKDGPLTKSTDLFKYVLSDSYQLSVIQRTLVNLLEHGDAAVFDAATGQMAPTIKIKLSNSDRARRRTFYASDEAILLQSLDCIEN